MPGQVLKRITLGAGAKTDIMTGTPHEFPDAMGNKITVAAGGDNLAGVLCTVMAGTRTILEEGGVTKLAADVNPKIPDDVVASGGVLPGERIRVFLIDGAGAGGDAVALVDLS